MNRDSWERVKVICSNALEMDRAERKAFVRSVCGDDHDLERAVLRLLDAEANVGSEFLSEPACERFVEGGTDALTGKRIGSWELVEQIGHGGMGTVYLARRVEGGFDQQAAVKIMRAAFADPGMRARFVRERQILARVEHPGIARLLDGGASPEGLLYLVMEYVEGEPIDDYCCRRNLSADDRIALFLRVCAAVRYLHQNLVVHRDLKPGNILVTAAGEPKLLDFGIATLLESEEARGGLTLGPVFTPSYASPEQLAGRAVTTASDAYSLGVILYELLTGVRPFGADDDSIPELARRMKEETPSRPSAVARSQSGARGEDHGHRRTPGDLDAQLARRLRGDLDAITLKALRPEPDKRYQSAEALEADLTRAREHLPVSARSDDRGYYLKKFLRRHRGSVAAGVVIAGVMVGAVVVSTHEARVARREKSRVEKVNAVLERILWSPNAAWYTGDANGRAEITVAEALHAAGDWLPSELAGMPEIEARYRYASGTTFAMLARYADAETELWRSLELHRSVFGERSAETAKATAAVAGVLTIVGSEGDAADLYRTVLDICDQSADCDALLDYLVPGTYWGLGLAALGKGDPGEAEALEARALQIRQAQGHRRDRLSANILASRGRALTALGALARAEDVFREALDFATGLERARVLYAFARLQRVQGNLEEAMKTLREAAEVQGRYIGAHHDMSANLQIEIARVRFLLGDISAAEETTEKALSTLLEILPDGHSDVARALLLRGRIRTVLGSRDVGEQDIRAALSRFERNLEPGYWEIEEARSVLGECLAGRGRLQEARRLLADSYEAMVAQLGSEDPRSRAAAERLAQILSGE